MVALFRQRGEPDVIRSDNGPEFIAKAINRCLEVSRVGTLYIELDLARRTPTRRRSLVALGRAAKEGDIHQSFGSEGPGRGTEKPLQPGAAA